MSIAKVLVIDDEQPILSMMEDILELLEVEMDGVETGNEALEKIKSGGYDLIICDLNLPDMDGKEFFVKAMEYEPGIKGKFVFSTGMNMDADMKSYCEQHSIRFLGKPFRIEDIQKLIQ
ncbi:MAG: hypothetical protein Kow00108_19410 [Calditrichia bacterium]